ncbi:methyltransferase domain-containing protein [Thermovibrio ammonificans]|uniref:Methyltransferase type 11 n=1 Tax=Thermovibrio ammonificans (strain DSM 15698 / JCM 12110 / HB-1) TaxID=648996 RepID=E8T5Z2_THEA1|nr:methyltransferase domain-containing protein [Thermovibrio ammonificans]ADU96576.1 Methyltransferase type 11 [Thermovibrio ammonificans HB-1]
MKEQIRKNFSRAADRYELHAALQQAAGREILKRLRLFPHPYPLLDVGAGTGWLLKGKGVVSLDIALGMCRTCKSRGNRAVCADAEEMPFKERSFRTVVSNFALQWTDLEKSLRECSRVLEPGGALIVTVPVEGSLRTLFECWEAAGGGKLFKFPEEKELMELIRKEFKPVEFSRLYLKKRFNCAKEALKAVNAIGAKSPLAKPNRATLLKFRELFEKTPLIEYRVLAITAVKD